MTAKIRAQIEYIKKRMGTHNNASIHTGKLSDVQMREFRKAFRTVRPELFGYTYFEKREAV